MVSGRERPEVASPRPAKGEFPDVNQTPEIERRATPKGLVGDRGNAKYADPVKREPAPTKPLARRTPPPAEPATQVVAAPPPPPRPEPALAKTEPLVPPPAAVTSQPLPAPAPAAPTQVAQAEPEKKSGKGSYVPSLDRQMPTARDEGPSAPPAVAPGGPPARPDVPETVPLPGAQAKRPGVQDYFNKRLAESRPAAPAAPEAVAMPSRSLDMAAGEATDAAPQLIAPRGMRPSRSARMAPEPKAPAATFQVASVDFSGASAELTAADRKALKEVAALYRKTGGTVRIVGRAPSSVEFVLVDPRSRAGSGMEPSLARANAVAKALSQAGVPAGKLFVAADPAPQMAAADSGGAQVFLDY